MFVVVVVQGVGQWDLADSFLHLQGMGIFCLWNVVFFSFVPVLRWSVVGLSESESLQSPVIVVWGFRTVSSHV